MARILGWLVNTQRRGSGALGCVSEAKWRFAMAVYATPGRWSCGCVKLRSCAVTEDTGLELRTREHSHFFFFFFYFCIIYIILPSGLSRC